MPYALVAIDERAALNQREAQGCGLLNKRRIEIDAAESRLGLGDSGLKRAKISDARCAARLEETTMQFDNLPQGDIPHQARRRYNSSFFRSTRSAADLKSSPGVVSRSAIAARARSSGARPRRSASWRNCSDWAGERSIVGFMALLYRVAAPSNNPLQRAGCAGTPSVRVMRTAMRLRGWGCDRPRRATCACRAGAARSAKMRLPVVGATPLAAPMIAAETAGQCRVTGFGSGSPVGHA